MPRNVFTIVLLVVPVALVSSVRADGDAPAKPEDLVIVQKGTLPIIVSAPHGGSLRVPEVPERKGDGIAGFITLRDARTLELAEAFVEKVEKKLDGKVWVVIAKFDRKYIDANRPRERAYESDAAKPYYDAYHDALTTACKAVRKKHGRGLLLDLHGQGVYPNTICRGTQDGKTVKVMCDHDGLAALTGRHSVLGHMEKYGYDIYPSCDAEKDTKEERNFRGGHIVGTYGSHTGYAIDAIQLEFGIRHRAKNRDGYPKTAEDLADAVAVYYRWHLADD